MSKGHERKDVSNTAIDKTMHFRVSSVEPPMKHETSCGSSWKLSREAEENKRIFLNISNLLREIKFSNDCLILKDIGYLSWSKK